MFSKTKTKNNFIESLFEQKYNENEFLNHLNSYLKKNKLISKRNDKIFNGNTLVVHIIKNSIDIKYFDIAYRNGYKLYTNENNKKNAFIQSLKSNNPAYFFYMINRLDIENFNINLKIEEYLPLLYIFMNKNHLSSNDQETIILFLLKKGYSLPEKIRYNKNSDSFELEINSEVLKLPINNIPLKAILKSMIEYSSKNLIDYWNNINKIDSRFKIIDNKEKNIILNELKYLKNESGLIKDLKKIKSKKTSIKEKIIDFIKSF